MRVINLVKKQNKKKPLKISKTGLEIEFFTLGETGEMVYKGPNLIKKVQKKYPSTAIIEECGKNMIEIGCYPCINTYNPAMDLIKSIEKTIKTAKKNKLRLYGFGTYPGKSKTKITEATKSYNVKEKIFGKETFSLATKAIGFHHHYAFPKGVFDEEKKELKLLVDSKLKRSLINSYNFEIAIDPILTLLTQSSPFFEGKLLAKDSRMLIYRGGKKLNYKGVYNKYQQVGGLPPYKQTATDLIRSLKNRQQRWGRLIKKVDPSLNIDTIYPFKLNISWNPVKINKLGTLEQRGMDMNYMSILLGVSALIKFSLKKIQREFIEVIPSDRGINEPFKIKKGVMFIPPHTHIREKLQKASAYEGYKNKELYEYTKKFYKFAKSVSPEFYYPMYKKIEDMINKKTSVSDEIINFAKRKNLITKKGTISEKSANIIALHFSKKFEKDLKETKRKIRKLMLKHQKVMK